MLRSGLILLALLALIPAANADAAVSQKKAIWGPVEIDGESQFPVYRDLRAGVYQTLLEYDQVRQVEPLDARDPEDPAYDWPDSIDEAISEGKKNGIVVALTATGAPSDADAYGDFLYAAAKRYPAVHIWSVEDGKTARYAQLLGAAYKGLKAASERNKVIAGNGNALAKGARYDYYGYDPSARTAPTKAKLAAVEKRAGDHKLWLGPVELPTSEGGAFRLTLAQQASWLKTAFKLVRADSHIATLSYRNLMDEDGAPYRGLLDTDGKKKPAYNAYKRG